MQKFNLGLLIVLILACQKHKNQSTYLGGKIVHPLDDYVILLQENQIIDSLKVDMNGRFNYRFNFDNPGLFTFRHAHEFQTLYLEPQDSLRLRVNTLEFDKSLVFDGTSATENNFLIENYLQNQKNSDLILSYYKTSPLDFEHKTDSIVKTRIKKLKSLKEKFNLSPTFVDIARKSIDFEFYDMRERYVFLLNKYNPSKTKLLSQSFFEYRNQIDFNDNSIKHHIGYQRFLDNYLKNQSIKLCKDKGQAKDCYSLNSYSNLDNRIKLVDSLIQSKYLRNRFLERFIQEEIIYAKAQHHLDHINQLIDKHNFSVSEKNRLNTLVDFQAKLIVGADLSEIKLKTPDFKMHKLKDVMKKNLSVIYSWSVESPSHFKLRIRKIKELKKMYPNVQFIGINIDYQKPDKWLDAVSSYDSNKDNEFLIVPEDNSSFYRNYLNKVFFLDKNCKIKKSEIILSNSDFDKHLKSFVFTED